MSTATVTSKGQITIPTNVRQALQVEAGDRVEFLKLSHTRSAPVHARRINASPFWRRSTFYAAGHNLATTNVAHA